MSLGDKHEALITILFYSALFSENGYIISQESLKHQIEVQVNGCLQFTTFFKTLILYLTAKPRSTDSGEN